MNHLDALQLTDAKLKLTENLSIGRRRKGPELCLYNEHGHAVWALDPDEWLQVAQSIVFQLNEKQYE